MKAASENSQLRKLLINAKNEITELKDHLKDQDELIAKLTAERDNYKSKIKETKDTVHKLEEVIKMRVTSAVSEEKDRYAKLEQELTKTRNQLKREAKRYKGLTNLDYFDQLRDINPEFDIFGNKNERKNTKNDSGNTEESDDRWKLQQQLREMAENFEDILAENRILRKMNNIPDSWGCEPQKRMIKFQDRETIYEYKRLVKILQEDNYNLENERAQLKHKIKQLAITGGMKADDRYKDLTPDQIARVMSFIIKLKSNDADEDKSNYELIKENRELKRELDILQTKGYNVIKQQLENFLKENKGSLFAGINFSEPKGTQLSEDQIKLMENMKNQQDKMRSLVEQMWTNMGQRQIEYANVGPSHLTELLVSQEEAGRFSAPKVTGIAAGYSSKFNTNINIPMAGSANSSDLPVLLLQIMELFALNDRKDNQIKTLESELERAYNKVRKYLLMQDQLYLNYVEELQSFKEKSSKYEQNIVSLKDQLREEQIKNENNLKTFKNLKLENDPMANQIINLQKKLALLEVENFRLSKKYSILSEQDKQLREAYHKVEEGFAEREKFAAERISKLKEWQIKAINEIKFLYSKFRDAVPLGEYQNVSKELFIVKQKFADLMEKSNRQAIINSKLQTENRELLSADEKLKLYEEIKVDLENELDYIQKRLEFVDPSYKWENMIFKKVVSVLKVKQVSPRQVFDYFDKDGNGILSAKEFLNALDKMGISDLKPKEKEILLRSIDADMDGTINYKEFCMKCGRYGVTSRSKEDEIVFIIEDTLKRNNLNLSEMFDIMDKNGKGIITKEDFKDTLISSRIKIDRKDLENFTDLFWKNKPEGINFRDFVRIYNRFKARFEAEQKGQDRQVGRLEITEEMVTKQKIIFDSLNKIFKKNGISLRDAYNKIDSSKDKRVSRVELRRLFNNMEIEMGDIELEILFRQLDFDDSGDISYLELESEFNRITETPLENLLALYHDMKAKTKRNFGSSEYTPLSEEFLQSAEMTLQTKYSIVQAKVTQLERKIEIFKSRLQKSENNQIIWEKDYDILEKKYYEVNEKYQDILLMEQITNAKLIGALPKEKSEELVLLSEKQKEQIVDLKAAMSSYKSLFEISTSQAKTLKLANRRSKDEEENLMFALRELQSNSIDKMKLGRIYYILMLSRWQEAAIGMKYDQTLNDLRNLRLEYAYIESRLKKEEIDKHSTENKLRDKGLQVEKLKQEIEGKTTSCISLVRAEEISKSLQDLADEKAEVEEKYIKVYSELNSTKFKVTECELRMNHSENMMKILRNATDTEISDKLIELSEKLMQIRRNELRCKREGEEYAEKALFAEKRVSQQKKTIVDLEDKLADFEGQMLRKEEEWRKADNDRQKKFFDAQFVNFETEKRYKGYAEEEIIPSSERIRTEELPKPPVGEYLIKKADVRIMEAKIKSNDEEISNLKIQLQSKEQQLQRLRDWQLEDNLLNEDEKMKDIIESNKVKIDQMHEKESQEMAEAAYKTIKTLQELIDTKNNQCKRKDDIIKELKERLNFQKQQDTAQILKLNEDLTKALKEKSNADHTYKETKTKFENREFEAISRRELELLCFDKDDKIEKLENRILSIQREKEYLLQNREEIEKSKLLAKNDELANQASQRVRALQLDIDRLTKELQKKEKVEKSLKDAMDEINDKLIRLEQMKGYTSEDMKIDALVNKKPQPKEAVFVGSDPNRVNELDKMLKAKEKRLIATTQKCKGMESELNEAKALISKLKESEAKLKEDIRGGQAMKQKILEDHQREKKDFIKIEKESKSKAEAGEEKCWEQTNELKTKLKQLERENIILKSQIKQVIAYNKENKSFEYIGEPCSLKEDEKPCSNIDEFLELAKEWLRINNRLTVSSIFNSFDISKSGYLDKELFEPIFNRIGIRIHKNEIAMLFECLKDEEETVWRYKPLVVELTTSLSQIEFIPACFIDISNLILKHDYDQITFSNEINKAKSKSITQEELYKGLDNLFQQEVSQDSVYDICMYYDNQEEGKLNPEEIANKIFSGCLAITIKTIKTQIEEKSREYARDAREGKLEETKGFNLDNEFSKIDREHDGFITFEQFK